VLAKLSHVRAVIVGRLGMHQLGAVGLSNMVFFFVTVFFSFLLLVTTPRVADALAIGNRREVMLTNFVSDVAGEYALYHVCTDLIFSPADETAIGLEGLLCLQSAILSEEGRVL
jgi:hypothetical protein